MFDCDWSRYGHVMLRRICCPMSQFVEFDLRLSAHPHAATCSHCKIFFVIFANLRNILIRAIVGLLLIFVNENGDINSKVSLYVTMFSPALCEAGVAYRPIYTARGNWLLIQDIIVIAATAFSFCCKDEANLFYCIHLRQLTSVDSSPV